MSQLKGFSYVTHQPMSLTLTQWRGMLSELVAAGGRRRVENGETFGHGKDGLIQFEVYGNVALKGAT
jgi:hypothetical protein